jgi:small subunit ribosomal protein S15
VQAERKKQLITEYGCRDNDTGGTEVQVALLTERIAETNAHLQVHRKDFACRRGLLMLVGRRSRLLRYLKKEDPARYTSLISRLGLRK